MPGSSTQHALGAGTDKAPSQPSARITSRVSLDTEGHVSSAESGADSPSTASRAASTLLVRRRRRRARQVFASTGRRQFHRHPARRPLRVAGAGPRWRLPAPSSGLPFSIGGGAFRFKACFTPHAPGSKIEISTSRHRRAMYNRARSFSTRTARLHAEAVDEVTTPVPVFPNAPRHASTRGALPYADTLRRCPPDDFKHPTPRLP